MAMFSQEVPVWAPKLFLKGLYSGWSVSVVPVVKYFDYHLYLNSIDPLIDKHKNSSKISDIKRHYAL